MLKSGGSADRLQIILGDVHKDANRRIRVGSCARAANGQPAAEAAVLMNSRRLKYRPEAVQ